MSKEKLHEQVNQALTNHPPVNPLMGPSLDAISLALRDVGHIIVEHCPESRELSLALTYLQQTRMFAVAAIALNQDKL